MGHAKPDFRHSTEANESRSGDNHQAKPASTQEQSAGAASANAKGKEIPYRSIRSDCCQGAQHELVESMKFEAGSEKENCNSGCCSGCGKLNVDINDDMTTVSEQCNSACCDKPVASEKNAAQDNPTKPTPAKDGCCASSAPPEPTQAKSGEGTCDDGCCSILSAPVTIKEEKPAVCGDGCCSGLVESRIENEPAGGYNNDCDNGCCDDPKPGKSQDSEGCRDACCSPKKNVSVRGDCCDGKKIPCCDEECIDRLVARECEPQCTTFNRSINSLPESCSDNVDQDRRRKAGSAESSQKQAECCPSGVTARQFYHDLLRRLGCLCHTVKARGKPTCCVPSRRTSLDTGKNANVDRSKKQDGDRRRFSSKNADRSSDKEGECIDDCCDKKPDVRTLPIEKRPGIGTHGVSTLSLPKLEDGVPDFGHVVLSVSGMTCSGCETKLQRSLATVEAIRNLRTSLILCRAEFDLDLRVDSVEGLIHQLHRITEFKYEELKQHGSEIEVHLPNVKSFVQQDLPMGVSSMQVVDKNTVRISYDPSIVGARELVEKKFGLVLSIAPVKTDASLAAGSKHVWHVGLMTLLSAALTTPVLVLAWAPLNKRPDLYGSVSLALATLVQFLIAGPFYQTALKSLIFARMIEMDLLIVISTSVAYVYSVVAFAYVVVGKPLATGEFFETSTLLVTLIMVGRWVSALARQKAIESVSVRSLQTSVATLVSEQDLSEREIDARLLQYGDLFRVAPESRIPTDGTVITGNSEVDESMMTGESLPVEKRPGAVVIAGSVNGSGVLTARISRLPGNNTISAIANMVDEAKLSKPKIQGVADKVASYFVPAAIALASLTFIIWVAIGLRVRHYDGSRAVTDALTYGITVIIVSCPCAVGLVVPMVIVVAGGVAAKHGFIFKSATTIEVARRTSHIVFDKTGTLTQGKIIVATEKYFEDESAIAAAVHTLLSNIKHPVSIAVKKHLEDKFISQAEVLHVISHPGKGVRGMMHGKTLRAGNPRWLGLTDHSDVKYVLSQGFTTFCFTVDGRLAALFGLQDSLRPDASQTVRELQRRGIEVSILSGDDDGPVSAVARQLNITNVRSKCTPADKQQFVRELTEKGNITVFCGDGTNDAVALAQATVGVHMNEGTDVAQSAADVVLIRSLLSDVITLIDVSKASMLRITLNFAWSLIYNIVAFLFASGALIKVRIPPEFAGLGELVSVLPVIAIAMQLRWAKFNNYFAKRPDATIPDN
ncbi:MAG: hypothetical protein M1820_005148 [Bogoriella megaspora]|nr:MAG: hypothetical protein M1820_005148 [Bogoriella megaspora]